MIVVSLYFAIPAAFFLAGSFLLGLTNLMLGVVLAIIALTRPFSPAKGFTSGEVSVARGHVFVRVPGKDIIFFDNKHSRAHRLGESKFWFAGTGFRRGRGVELEFITGDAAEKFNRDILGVGFATEPGRNPAPGRVNYYRTGPQLGSA